VTRLEWFALIVAGAAWLGLALGIGLLVPLFAWLAVLFIVCATIRAALKREARRCE
jgi:hypothetical protein